MMNIDVVRQKLLDGDTDVVLKELVDLYRRAEILHTPQLSRILEALFPVWRSLLLSKLPHQFTNTSVNRCRKLILQILNRLPSNDASRPYVTQLLQVLLDVLQRDNEENALIALKTIFDLHRNYRPALRNEVQAFLEIVQQLYKGIPATLKKQLIDVPPPSTRSTPATTPATTPSSSQAATDKAEPEAAASETNTTEGTESAPQPSATTTAEKTIEEVIPSSLESFKTISELPLIIMLLFQCYPNYIESYVPVLVPLMMNTLALRAPESAARAHISRYVDFLDAQVKTLSFVTYLLRGCANLMRPFQDSICECTVKLLMACPKDAFVLRKDIFVAARHIISTEFRRGFYSQLDVLMDDDVLIGKGRCSFHQIRPLAYSTLADMIHHVRDMLTLAQVSKIVDFYGKRIHDATLPISIQTTSIRLLLNLVDISAKNEDTDGWKGRNILSRMLLIIATKFRTTLTNLPVALLATLKHAPDRNDLLEGGAMEKIRQSTLLPQVTPERSATNKKLESLLQPYMHETPHDSDGLPDEEPNVRDIKSLLRTMILGIRAVIWCTANYRNPNARDLTNVDGNAVETTAAAGTNDKSASLLDLGTSGSSDVHLFPLSDDERLLIAKVFRDGLRCFILYTLSDNTLAEEKQMLDHFAGAFTVLDAPDFRDLFIAHIPLLYHCILQDHAILTIPQHFLANANVSCWFAEILLKFLITQMDDLSVEAEGDLPDTSREDKVLETQSLVFERMRPVPHVHRASVVLRLFKIVFGSVTLFKSNESALFPHLRTIIESCLRKATYTKHPDNYLLLLRALFRSISGGKYETFYKEVFPLLPGILSALMRLQKYIKKAAVQEVLLELCLTIPARLSSLLQYLPSLMKSVVRAILSRGELAYLGLRTLEFWVDNLNPDFLYPIMTSQERLLTEIIEALKSHLLPPPYPYGELAMRILGKIGGRNRRYLLDPLDLNYADQYFGGLVVDFQWNDLENHPCPIEMDVMVQQAIAIVERYVRKNKHDWGSVGKVDSRLTDVDEPEEADQLYLMEKDERTLELETETIDTIRETILSIKQRAFKVVAAAAVISLQSETIAAQKPQYFPARSIVVDDTKRNVQKQMLLSLFKLAGDLDLGVKAQELRQTLLAHMTTRSITRCTRLKPQFAALSCLRASTLYPTPRGLSMGKHLATPKRIETLREATYGVADMAEDAVSNDMYAAFHVLLEALSSCDHVVVNAAKSALETIVATVVQHFESLHVASMQAGAFFNLLCDVFSHACYDKSTWRRKLGGTIGLSSLVRLMDARWCHENQLLITKGLLFVLSDHPAEVGAIISEEAGMAVVKTLNKSWDARSAFVEDPNDGLKQQEYMACVSFQDTEVLQMFVVDLLGSKAPARRYARECIELYARFATTSVSSLLFPYHQVISKQVTTCNLKSLSMGCRTGYIDTIAYGLSLEPPIFSMTKEMLAFLQEVWSLISDDTASGSTGFAPSVPRSDHGSSVSSTADPSATSSASSSATQEYPFGLSQGCELRIAAVKLFRASFLSAPDEVNQHHEARNRFLGVFFRFLTGQPIELVTIAQQALSDVIHLNKQSKDISLPKELLQQCLRPILLNLADYRNLNLPLLDGLSRLLTLLSSCFNVTLGEKLLEHLKQWRDPDRITKTSIWKRGEEPLVAAAIIDLFHLLPPNDAFLDPLVNCVVELEAVLPSFGSFGKMSSPYRIPLTKFLNRYASQAVAFFLKRENLIELKFSTLFQQVIKLEDAGPLRDVITADGGGEMLVAATFLAASKTTESKPSDASEELKMQQQIQLNAQKAAAQAVASAQAQGMTPTVAEARGMQARAAYVAKAQAQVNAQQALKVQSHAQIQANAQKLHAQTLAAAQAQGLSLVQAQAKAQLASKDYIAKAQNQIASATSSPLASPHLSSQVSQLQAQQLHAQIQVNAQKVHAQALAAAQAQGLKPIQAQEKAKQAQATYVHRAKAQAQAKMARAQGLSSASLPGTPSSAGPFASKSQLEVIELQYQGLRLVRTVCKLHPTWLSTQPVVVDCLRKLWRSPARIQRFLAQDRLALKHHSESKLLVKCLINYCRAKQDDVQVLLDLVSVFLHQTSFDFAFLEKFYRQEVATTYSAVNKRNLIRLFLRTLRDATVSEDLKVRTIQLVIIPVLTTSFEDPTVDNAEVMDQDTIMWMLREILASKDYAADAMLYLRIKLLKLGTLLIQHMSKYVTEHRKEVIKFAWNHLKAQDLTSKLWAYVNVCRFISVYDTPPKIVLQVYVALLRTYEMDSRFLVRKAFDILLPALPARLPPSEFIKAIKWTKKIAYEEGHMLGQLVHIWFLIVHHPALFYPFRSQFVPLMVNSLNRLAIPPSSTPDNRRLAVSIVDLVISWEQTRRERLAFKATDGSAKSHLKRSTPEPSEDEDAAVEAVKKRRTGDDLKHPAAVAIETTAGAETTGPRMNEDEFELNGTMVDLVINFAFRFALASADKQETSRLSKVCGELFDKAIRLWSSASVRFSYFDKLIAVTAEALIRQQQASKAAGENKTTPSEVPATQPSMPPFFTVPKGAPLSSLAILDAVLGILNSLVAEEVITSATRSVPYVIQYAPRVMKLLEPCFDRPSLEIQTQLIKFLKRIAELYPPSRAPQQLVACKFYVWLRDIISERLAMAALLPSEASSDKSKSIKASTAQLGTPIKSEPKTASPVTGPSQSPPTAAAPPAKRPKSTSDALRLKAATAATRTSPISFQGEFALKLLATIVDVIPEFVDHFAPSLLKLGQRFTREHLIATGSMGGSKNNASSGSNATGLEGASAAAGEPQGRNAVMATPSLAIVDEWEQMQAGRSMLSINNVVRHVKRRVSSDDKTKKKTSADSKDTTTKAMAMNSNGRKKQTTASLRKTSMDMLSTCFALLSKCSFATADHRRLYTSLLVHCLESSPHIPLLLQITKIVEYLITSDTRQVLTTKDKMTLLSKMSMFDRLNEVSAIPLNEAYCNLILKLCGPTDGKSASYLHISPTSQSQVLSGHLMMGLLAPNASTRRQFQTHFFANCGTSPTARLQLVLRQDWQACGTRYWPVIAVETLASALSIDTCPSLHNGTADSASAMMTTDTRELMGALCELAHVDLVIAQALWVHLFCSVWKALPASEQTQVSSSMMKLLASKFNKKALNVPFFLPSSGRLNAVQTMLQGVVGTDPSCAALTPELVLHLALNYGAWSTALRIAEFQVQNPQQMMETRLRWVEVLSTLYKNLNEDDLRVGLSLENVSQPESRMGLLLESLGCVHEAQEEYFRALSKAQSGRLKLDEVNLFELRLWEERWVDCAKQLCQWQLMNDFAKSTQNQDLLLDCAWKRGDWNAAKQLLLSPTMQSVAEQGCPETRLQRLYISILDGEKRSIVDNLVTQTADLALHQWQTLPRVLSRAHVQPMHLFHKFVEVKESIQMMNDIKNASQLHSLPNLKPSINTWRERLPNKWEPILLWDDILTWRSHMFQVVKSTFSWSDAQMLACIHDTPWSVIKLAHTARKQHLPDVCLGALSKLYSVPAMDVQDAFSKLREQVSICYESSTEYNGGLSILNNTNLDYFSLRQKAEMFRLKALFLEAMGQVTEANQTFSHCLQICDSYGKGWLSWGHYCYRLFMDRKELSFASQTIACYLQAIHHRCNSARLMIARVLWLLSMDDQDGKLIHAFEAHGKQLPIWIWIIWIPQLLMALGRPEAPQIRGLLRGLSAKFPQALYYTMRAFFLENRESAMMLGDLSKQPSAPPTPSGLGPSDASSRPPTPTFSDGGSASGDSLLYIRTRSGNVVAVPANMPTAQLQAIPGLIGPPRQSPGAFGVAPNAVLSLAAWKERSGAWIEAGKPDIGPVQYTEDLLNFLRRSHDALTFDMECMLEEMIIRFRPEPEEELLTAVHALLLKCYQLPRLTTTEPIPKMLRATLAKVCKKFFILLPHQKNEKHMEFVRRFKDRFESDFATESNESTMADEPTLYEIMDRLKRWKTELQALVRKCGKRNADKLYMESCSRHLIELASSPIEVPGQYISDNEPIKDLHARIVHFDSTADVLLRNGYTQRRIAMGGSDGRTHCFLVQYAMTHITRTDERMMQMFLLLNRLLIRHKETKKRNTLFHIPKIIPLTPRVRLLEDSRDFVTLGEVYELDCQLHDKDPDLPVELYRERISEAFSAAGSDDDRIAQAKATIFDDICAQHVPETLLSKYVHGISAHLDAYVAFRNEFTKHLALSSFLSYALFVWDRPPHRILFSRCTGRVVSTELRPGYASSGLLESTSAMPFRLTRNLHNFVTRAGVQGPFSITMAAAADALMSEEDILRNQLSLFFRDDLVSWHLSKSRLTPVDGSLMAGQRRLDAQVQQRVDANLGLVIDRIRGVSLKKESESPRGKSVRELLEIATSAERQRDMYPTWFPWL